MSGHKALQWNIWRQRVIANAWSESIGLGGSALAGFILVAIAPPATPVINLLIAVAMVTIATVLEGGIVGLAQWQVLRQVLHHLTWQQWVSATARGVFVAWSLGMLPSTILSLQETNSGAPPEPNGLVMAGLAVLMGFILGSLLGFFQWQALHQHLPNARGWILFNTIAWAGGMPIIFAGAGSLSAEASPLTIGGMVIMVCLLTGAIVGGIHGFGLIWLLRRGISCASQS
ncbi:MAG: hypothetical protein HC879_02320 [Leptolyngbyaceae cyanobacterium SL_5_9]|nr:hypothetical protein [Leptolyngbyaceae cyanobacterium SL_5_9]NJO72749.1 hypothetical protein [Leptolyngbyaceae cyanobacterium RM1_406_9]